MCLVCLCVQRTLTEQQRDSLSADFEGLNLTRYIQEAVSSLDCAGGGWAYWSPAVVRKVLCCAPLLSSSSKCNGVFIHGSNLGSVDGFSSARICLLYPFYTRTSHTPHSMHTRTTHTHTRPLLLLSPR